MLALEMPKSPRRTMFLRVRKMFCGLRSRWSTWRRARAGVRVRGLRLKGEG